MNKLATGLLLASMTLTCGCAADDELDLRRIAAYGGTATIAADAQKLDLGPREAFYDVVSNSDPACPTFHAPTRFHLSVNDPGGLFKCDDSRVDVDACAGEGDLIAFEYRSDELFFWINFEPTLVDGPITEARLRSLFRWLWYSVSLQKTGDDKFSSDRVYVDNLANADVFHYENGRLHVELHTEVERMVRWIEPVGGACFDTDVAPQVCACKYPVALPVHLDLNLVFPSLGQ